VSERTRAIPATSVAEGTRVLAEKLAPFTVGVGAREALLASAALIVLLGVGKSLMPMVAFGPDVVFTLAAAFQLYVPLWLIQRRGEAPESHGIHAHGLFLGPVAALRARLVRSARRRRNRLSRGLSRTLAHYGRGARLDGRGLAFSLGLAVVAALVTFPPFAIGHAYWQEIVVGRTASFVWRLPPDLVEIMLRNTFLVALPEELFYRGFVETRLERRFPSKFVVLLIPISRTVILASALFALGHFVGEWNLARLGPFFPAFVFSALTRKSGSIAGAVVYHGLSNAFSATLLFGYAAR
jgi:membrane protease YdiL (CAAX protease family)